MWKWVKNSPFSNERHFEIRFPKKEKNYFFLTLSISTTQKRPNFACDSYVFPKTRGNKNKQCTHSTSLKWINSNFLHYWIIILKPFYPIIFHKIGSVYRCWPWLFLEICTHLCCKLVANVSLLCVTACDQNTCLAHGGYVNCVCSSSVVVKPECSVFIGWWSYVRANISVCRSFQAFQILRQHW